MSNTFIKMSEQFDEDTTLNHDSELDEILKTLFLKLQVLKNSDSKRAYGKEVYAETYVTHITEAKEALTAWHKAQALKEVLEIIGEDENIGVDPEWPLSRKQRRDDFRAELRTAAKKKYQ